MASDHTDDGAEEKADGVTDERGLRRRGASLRESLAAKCKEFDPSCASKPDPVRLSFGGRQAPTRNSPAPFGPTYCEGFGSRVTVRGMPLHVASRLSLIHIFSTACASPDTSPRAS